MSENLSKQTFEFGRHSAKRGTMRACKLAPAVTPLDCRVPAFLLALPCRLRGLLLL